MNLVEFGINTDLNALLGFAPDVYLNGIASKLSVAGLQDAGVQACAKQ